MTSCSKKAELRRARPLLGTIVEITATGNGEPRLADAVESAFAAIARVHALMSFHETGSDVSLLNQSAARRAVAVDGWTYEVLSEAQTLSERSGGVFDITVASKLVAWDFLPRQPWNGRSANATWRDIDLLPGNRVRFRRNLALDLGGIAKGFAVDKAVEALQEAGIESGVVNAGGDLRVFGSCARTVHVRRPDSPTRFLLLDDFLDESVATSAPYFSLHRHGDREVSPLINPATGRPVTSCISVSVRAPRCIHADALTKIVLADPDGSVELLRTYGARAYMLSPSSREVETL